MKLLFITLILGTSNLNPCLRTDIQVEENGKMVTYPYACQGEIDQYLETGIFKYDDFLCDCHD